MKYLWAMLLWALVAQAEAREWANAQGRKFEARFISVSGVNILFEMETGKRFEMPLLDLCPADQAFIRGGQPGPIESLEGNFGRPWPVQARPAGNPACKVISEDRSKGHYIYESPGYRFQCDSRITPDALAGFATLFESTRAYLSALPISLMSGETMGTRSRILMFGERSAYVKSGGMEGSAGCFLLRHRLVLVPMESLGLVKGGTGYGRDMSKENHTLVHELVHQLTPQAYYAHGSLGWFSEGLAEYVAATPYFSGSFRPDIHGNAVKEYVVAYGPDGKRGRGLGQTITAPALRDFMLMDYRTFSGADANRNYAVGLLLTHYFFHMEGGGKARRISLFLKGLHDGMTGEAALAPLLGGGGYEELGKDIAREWAKKGIQLSFGG